MQVEFYEINNSIIEFVCARAKKFRAHFMLIISNPFVSPNKKLISSVQSNALLFFAAVQPFSIWVGVLSIFIIALLAFLYFRQRSKIVSLSRINEELNSENKKFLDQIDELKTVCSSNLNDLGRFSKNIDELKYELDIAKRTAEEADLLKSNFLANMSHEIRTPMNGILGFAQLLQHEEVDRDKHDRYLDIICHNGTMLVNLIDDIMDISRIEAGQLALNKSEVNIDDILFDLYTFFNEIKFKQEKEHISIRLLNLNDDENCVFYTDGQRIRQVLANLISNSLKFTDKGIVEFGYINNSADKNIQFYVRDTGIGIPKDKQSIIFERFRQIEEGSTRKYGGTGIGLFISRHIVELLGGKIWLESGKGNGSSFYFSLPYESMTKKDDHTEVFKPARIAYDWSDIVILVAEDVETNYRYLKAVLGNTKASVVWARDGEEVVNYCNENPDVDLVLMDIQMPKLNGYEATAEIRKNYPDLKIIAQTAYALPNDNIKCIEAGCNDYISKPINSSLLLDKIDQHLTSRKPKTP